MCLPGRKVGMKLQARQSEGIVIETEGGEKNSLQQRNAISSEGRGNRFVL
jgi:hypothetical protein